MFFDLESAWSRGYVSLSLKFLGGPNSNAVYPPKSGEIRPKKASFTKESKIFDDSQISHAVVKFS